jgi:phage terminase large subunit-like protein
MSTTIDRKELEESLTLRQQLLAYIKAYPLAAGRLWEPFCCRWDGLSDQSPRARGCGEKMSKIAHGLYRCEKCDITEERTSQKEAILSLADEATLISGGNRSGKSHMGAQIAVAFAAGKDEKWVQDWITLNDIPPDLIPNRPSTVWCGSLSYKDGLEYLRPKLDQFLPRGTRKTRWNSQDRAVAILPNKGRIVSMSCDAGREAFQGGSVSLVWLDEEPPEAVFEECILRTVDQRGKVIITATPLKGMSWMFDRFVDSPPEGFARCQISGLDNPYISSVKMRRAVGHLSEEAQRSRLYGDFAAQSGLIYAEFHPERHLIELEEIPDHWTRYRSIDFGTSHPFCCLWFAVAPSGLYASDEVLIVYRELYWTEKTTLESGREILRLSKGEDFSWTVADPESRDGRLTLARELELRTLAAPKHMGVVEGINMVKGYLAPDLEGRPRLLISTSCKNLIRELKLYKWDTKSKIDRPVKKYDHALDALRYQIMQYKRFQLHQ